MWGMCVCGGAEFSACWAHTYAGKTAEKESHLFH